MIFLTLGHRLICLLELFANEFSLEFLGRFVGYEYVERYLFGVNYTRSDVKGSDSRRNKPSFSKRNAGVP